MGGEEGAEKAGVVGLRVVLVEGDEVRGGAVDSEGEQEEQEDAEDAEETVGWRSCGEHAVLTWSGLALP